MKPLLLVLLAASASTSAQPVRSTWASAGAGVTVGGGQTLAGASLGATAPLGSGREVYHVGGSAAASFSDDAALQRVLGLQVGYGYALSGRRGTVALVVGPAMMLAEQPRTTGDRTSFGGFVGLQALAAVSRRVGLGAEVVGQASGDLSTLSGRLVLAFGRS